MTLAPWAKVIFSLSTCSITTNRFRSLPLINNVSINGRGCYRIHAPKGTFLSSPHGDIFIESRQPFGQSVDIEPRAPQSLPMAKPALERGLGALKIGRASCRERG